MRQADVRASFSAEAVHCESSASLSASPSGCCAAGVHSALLLGEGSFTFARALHAARPELLLVASGLEQEGEARALWQAGPQLDALLPPHGRGSTVAVAHGVDATRLERDAPRLLSLLASLALPSGKVCSPRPAGFDRVLFTFPHSGAKGRIQANRALLSHFSASVAASGLMSSGGAVEVTLAAGQGGTPLDALSLEREADDEEKHAREANGVNASAASPRRRRPRAAGDTWQLSFAAADGGLVLCSAEVFDALGWAALGYAPSGCWRGLGKGTRAHGFRTHAAVAHVLRPQGGGPSVTCPFPQETFAFDASLWLRAPRSADGGGGDESAALLACTAGDVLVAARRVLASAPLPIAILESVAPALGDADSLWRRQSDGVASVCLRFRYAPAAGAAWSPARAKAAHAQVLAALPSACGAVDAVRTNADQRAPPNGSDETTGFGCHVTGG